MNKKEEKLCVICCGKINKSTQKEIKCDICEFVACLLCIKRYILDSNTDYHCMNCRNKWNRSILVDKLPQSFIKGELREHEEERIVNLEKARLPLAQTIAEERIKCSKLNEILSLQRSMDDFQDNLYQKELMNMIAKNFGIDLNSIDSYKSGKNLIKEEKREYIRNCPNSECRGFINEKWTCGLCNCIICKTCFEELGELGEYQKHICDSNILESNKVLIKDTKPCPKCNSMIHKLSGCFGENTPILLWKSQLKKSQDIIVGDELIGDDGNKRIVLDICKGEDDLFNVEQSNGINYIVNSKHDLVLKYPQHKLYYWVQKLKEWKLHWLDKNNIEIKTKTFSAKSKDESFNNLLEFSKKIQDDNIINICINRYIKLPDSTKNMLFGFINNQEFNYPEKKLNLEPYLLGIWLGSGRDSTTMMIESKNIEIKNYLFHWCLHNNSQLIHVDTHMYRIAETLERYTGERTNLFFEKLEELNLIDNKHIPLQYLLNSKKNRLELLAGVIDSLGEVEQEQHNKRVSIFHQNKYLIKNIIFLAKSLGFFVGSLNLDNNKISIFGNKLCEVPSLIYRKKWSNFDTNNNYLLNRISVQYAGRGNYYGWLLDRNHRFLLEDFTIVKNCDQMFCTICNTAFSWTKGTIEKGPIHNPHYFAWKIQNAKSELQNTNTEAICNDNQYPTIMMLQIATKYSSEFVKKWIMYFLQYFLHIDNVVRPVYEPIATIDEKMEINVEYMIGKICKTEWKKQLYSCEKRQEMARDIIELIDMAITISGERFRKIINESNTHKNKVVLEPVLFEINNLIDYIENEVENIRKRFMIKNIIIPEQPWNVERKNVLVKTIL